MNTRGGVAGLIVFLTVFFLVLIPGAGAVEINGKRNPPLPGKQASELITATGPGFTTYYVKTGTARIKTQFMEEFAKSPVAKFVNEGNKKGWSIKDIVIKGQAAGHSPCDLLKGFIIQGAQLQPVIKVFLENNFIHVCALMKCALEAVRGMKMVEVKAGHYAIITPGCCAVEGSMTQDDWDRLEKLMAKGLISKEELPHYPLDKKQSIEAQCCETQELTQVFLEAGADIEDLRVCFDTMGCKGLGYIAPPPLPLSPQVPFPGVASPSS